ncbi:AbrB/MazE/SpoVT family DNA-binding domain-containing protein [Andreprevotia chitinilytica]|uniref:AbrB/MazE/SpoVT family DNA-binding domain-containing protein n=1 Tax=Andreprevotia chitinilytica TaxID=396808 RepID=UPI0005541813|nr:AbrB/MazE/SpoVT family DNA-binding domain-containing protein [Andreprevotia chitinilytica]
MPTATLRRSGGSLIMVIPPLFAEQNHLTAGASVSVQVVGDTLTVQPLRRRRYDVAALLAETPEEFMGGPEWDQAPPAGQEVW